MELLVTDRTLTDVGKTVKGSYNCDDLNRVGRAINEIAQRLGLAIAAKTNWLYTDFPTRAALDAYIRLLQTVREAYYILPTTPTIPQSMDYLDYVAANNIEQMLTDVQTMIRGCDMSKPLCGAVISGIRGFSYGLY